MVREKSDSEDESDVSQVTSENGSYVLRKCVARGRGKPLSDGEKGKASSSNSGSNITAPSGLTNTSSKSLLSTQSSNSGKYNLGGEHATAVSAGMSRITEATRTTELIKAVDNQIIQKNVAIQSIYEKYYYKDDDGDFLYPSYEKLPILDARVSILEALGRSQCLIIRGETGSGKTTQVPQYILDECAVKGESCTVWVTQPRKIAARTVSQRVSERDALWSKFVPGIVGYRVGLDKCVHPDSRIIYMTPGIVSRCMHASRNLDGVTHLVIDEVHERDIETEILLLLVKHLMKVNPIIKVILMSATIDTEVYEKYFKDVSLDSRPQTLEVKGRVFPVDVKYIEDLQEEMPACPYFNQFKPIQDDPIFDHVQVLMVRKIVAELDHKEKDSAVKGSVLVFLPGLFEIDQTKRALMKAENSTIEYKIYRVHSTLNTHKNNRELKELLTRPRLGVRKIILSTIICESSITVPDITTVIDLCMTKLNEKCKVTNLNKLTLKWASHENCDQRKGRAGRVQSGVCYRLLDRHFYFHSLFESIPPEIGRCQLETSILTGKAIFPEMTPHEFLAGACSVPKDVDIELGIKSLKEHGALSIKAMGQEFEAINNEKVVLTQEDLKDGILTPLGQLICALPLDISSSRMIFIGAYVGLLEEAIIIAACTEHNIWSESHRGPILSHKPDALETVDQLKNVTYWSRGTESDHIATLKAFLTWLTKMPRDFREDEECRNQEYHKLVGSRFKGSPIINEREEYQWCNKMGLNRFRLRDAQKLCDDITKRMINLGYYAGEKASIIEARKNLFSRSKGFTEMYTTTLKIIIGGATYPNFFRLEARPHEENDVVEAMKYFNPLTTVYFHGAPRDKAYQYGKDIYNKMSRCGKISRMYFYHEYVFIEFDRVSDLPSLYTMEKKLTDMDIIKRNIIFGRAVTPAVKFALRSGKRSFSNPGMRAFPSSAYQPEKLESGIFYINFEKYNFRTRFPKRKIDPQMYQIQITAIYGLTIFFGVRIDLTEQRDELDDVIQEIYINGQLIAIKGEFNTGQMVAAPFKEDNSMTYHRAIIIQNIPNSTRVLLQYADYGDIEVIESSCLFTIPEDVTTPSGCKIVDIPLMAVKYRLRGVKFDYGLQAYTDDLEIPQSQGWKFYESMTRWVRIFSTFEGDCVLVDSFQMDPSGLVLENNEKLHPQSDNAILLTKETHLIQYIQESFGDLRSFKLWCGSEKPSGSGKETTDSGRETKEDSASFSSYEATSGEDWIELKDISSHDSGLTSGSSSSTASEATTMAGPFNAYSAQLTAITQCGIYRQTFPSMNSVNSIICTTVPARNPQRLIVGNMVEIHGQNTIQPHYTTMMPDINGIVPLMYLMFAPIVYVESWATESDKGTRIRKLTAGLGVVKDETTSEERDVYEAHNAFVDLDVEIDDADLRDCANIRSLFRATKEDHNQAHMNYRSRIKEGNILRNQMMRLLCRKRQFLKSIKQAEPTK